MSEAERLRLCALWHGEHSYQGWSIMLGCKGRRPAETELLCRNVGALVRLRCGFVDFAQAKTEKMGGVYGDAFWLRDDQSRSPPRVCGSRRTLHMGRVAIAMSVYPEAVGGHRAALALSLASTTSWLGLGSIAYSRLTSCAATCAPRHIVLHPLLHSPPSPPSCTLLHPSLNHPCTPPWATPAPSPPHHRR